jgi:hypothetical protein
LKVVHVVAFAAATLLLLGLIFLRDVREALPTPG